MENRERLAGFIVRIYALSQAARVYGLLYLEDLLDDAEPAYFREGLVLVVNGTDPEEVDLYGKALIEKASSPEERLFREIAREGLLRIQCGDSPVAVWLNLASRLGDGGIAMVKARLLEFERRRSAYFSSLKMIPADSALTGEFTALVHDEFILTAGSVLMITDQATLAAALRGCAPDLQARVLQNLPMGEMRSLMERQGADPSRSEVEQAMRAILEAHRKYG